MKFDVVIMNPPYQAPSKKSIGGFGGRVTLWDKFVDMSINILKYRGKLVAIHPPRWRKPEDETGVILSKYFFRYIEMHNSKDGLKTFGAGTRYDWYILSKEKPFGNTEIKTEDGKILNTNISNVSFLPSANFDLFKNIIANKNEKRCDILYSRSNYGRDKPWMSEEEVGDFKIKCIHSILKNGEVRYMYSSKNNGMIKIPKVIISENQKIQDVIVDFDGEFAFTSGCFSIIIESKEEGEKIKKALLSKTFSRIIKSTKWSSFRIEWKMFKYFRKDFWKEFVNEEGMEK